MRAYTKKIPPCFAGFLGSRGPPPSFFSSPGGRKAKSKIAGDYHFHQHMQLLESQFEGSRMFGSTNPISKHMARLKIHLQKWIIFET